MPNYLPALQTGAQEFLRNTNKAYDECARGIAELDRIIVSVAANRADAARAYLIPILYAYWERFFRTSFTEYIRVLSNVAVFFIDSHIPLTLVRLRREFNAFAKESNVGRVHELSDRYTCAELALLLDEFADWINGPVTFRDPERWVDTESNVQFGVLEKNCRNIGLEVDSLKTAIQHSKSLFQGLKDLVDKRNSIAHGEVFEPVGQREWEATRSFVLDLLNVLQDELHQHLQDPAKVIGPLPSALKPNSAVRPGQFC